jgi:plasmid stabilization system protein ParE
MTDVIRAQHDITVFVAERDRAMNAERRVALLADAALEPHAAPDIGHLAEARGRYRDVREWSRRIERRVQSRIEEHQVLSETLWTLLPGPALVFYPIIRWNVRSVIWDGEDPDAEEDAVNRYCSRRLHGLTEVHDPKIGGGGDISTGG